MRAAECGISNEYRCSRTSVLLGHRVPLVILHELALDAKEFEARTGWAIKPQGACKGEVCVPLPEGARTPDGRLDAQVVAERLGMPLVRDDAHDIWALGPETAIT